jgi:glycosyltransferase involved in cell wall biosynthesis
MRLSKPWLSRVPVIATDIAGSNEAIIEGQNGLLVPPGDSVALTRALEKMFNSSQVRMKMADAARATVEKNFTIKRHIEKVENIYLNLLQQKGVI